MRNGRLVRSGFVVNVDGYWFLGGFILFLIHAVTLQEVFARTLWRKIHSKFLTYFQSLLLTSS